MSLPDTAPDGTPRLIDPIVSAPDHARPLAFDVLGEERRSGARVLDVTFDDGADGRVSAFVIAPTVEASGPSKPIGAPAAGPGIVWAHWFDSEHPNADRTEFLPDAIALAAKGVTSVLPQGAFPWTSDPTDSATDGAKVEAEVLRLQRCLDLLVTELGADPARLAMVGHDFGGMAVAVALATDRRPVAGVILAATPRWGDWFLPFWPIAQDRLEYLAGLRPVDPIEWVGRIAPAAVLYQFARRDVYIAPMTGHELHRATSEPRELRWYDAAHDLDVPEARADRLAFLEDRLGLTG